MYVEGVRVRVCVLVTPNWCWLFLEQESLLALLQYIQLLKWGPSDLVSSGKPAYLAVIPGINWGSKCQLTISHAHICVCIV